MPIHLAITRRVRPGREGEFEKSLREFLRDSLVNDGVVGVHFLAPLPGSGSREYGILRTFASESDRADFYQSSAFQAWERRVRPLTEGSPRYRELHGLEAWFKAEGAPPRWKMALLTFAGVYCITLVLTLAVGPLLKSWPLLLANAVFNLAVVSLLTWAIMPGLTHLAGPWLHPAASFQP
jgi:antibiotic biosynthesis monooxygenase (ABM) superfamily enzyme